MDQAFDKTPGARDNFVAISDLRKTMPHLTKGEFDAVVRKGQDDGTFTLNTSEGNIASGHSSLTPERRAGALEERVGGLDDYGRPRKIEYIFISRRT
jgi:hypothetical protein